MAAEEIGVLRVDLSLDSADFVKSTQQVDSKLRALNSEFKASKSGVEGFEKSVEGLRAKQDNLTKTLDLQKTKVNALKDEYEKIAQAKGKNSVEAEKLLTKYNNAVAAMRNTELQLDKTNRALKEQENAWRKAEQGIEEYKKKIEATSTKLSNFGDKMKAIGGNLSVGLTAPILAAGTAVGMIATQFENAQVKIQNSLGLTTEEAEKLSEVAENVWAKGFGESLEEVSDALIRVKQNFKDIKDEAQLEQITRDSILLAKTFDSDVNEVTRAGNNLMVNFGIESKKAYDLMANGAQNGLNFSNEMFDNLAEYSGLFAKMGFSAEEYFQLLINGSKEGVYNLDYINDVMKEFQIRVKDGSKSTDDAMSKMSKSTQNVWKEFLKGNKTVKDVSNTVLKELEGMDNQVEANSIGVALFGTKWEDLEADAMYSLQVVDKEMKNVTGTMEKMAKAQEQTFSQRWQELLRSAQKGLEPIGTKILDIAEKWLPKLTDGLDRAVKWFDELGEEGQSMILTLAGLAAAGGPLFAVGGMFANGASNVMKLGSSLMDAASKGGALGAVMTTISGPVGWAILGAAAITGLGVAMYHMNQEAGKSLEELLKLQDEGFKDTVAAYDQAKAIDDLASEYDGLRDKSKLTTDEMLEFKDIQKEISSTTSDEKLAKLKERQSELYSASGLTNDELDRMIQLDGDLQKNVDGVVVSFDTKGNAIVKYNEKLKEATNLQLEIAKADLKTALNEGLFAFDEALNTMDKANGLIEEHNKKIKDIKPLYDDAKLTYENYKKEVEDYYNSVKEAEEQKGKYSQAEITAMHDQLAVMNSKGITLKDNLDYYKSQLDENQKIVEEQTIQRDNAQKLYLKLQSNYNEYMNILASETGITGEQGKQLQQMKEQYNRNAELIKQIERKKETEGKITKEEQDQLTELKNQQQQLETNIGKAEDIHEILGKDVEKFVEIDDGGKVKEINDELKKTIQKKVVANIESAWGNVKNVFGYEKGTNYHPGGLAIVGEKGYELGVLPNGKQVMLGVGGQGLYDLPTGTKVYTHAKTKNILSQEVEVTGVKSDLRQIGSDTMAGLNLGIQSGSGSVMNTMLGVGSGIEDTLRKRLDIHSPSRVTKEIGYWISVGLADGIKSGKPKIDESITEIDKLIIKETTKTADEVLKLQKEYAKADKKEREKINQEILKVEQESHSNQLKAIEDFVSEKKSLNELSLMDEVAIWRESVNYFAENNSYAQQTEAHKKYRDSLEAINKEILSVNEDYSSQMIKVNEELQKREKELTETYTKAVDDRAKALFNFTNLFDEFDFKFEASGEKLLSNLQSQVDAFKMWQVHIEALSARAIDEGLLEHLRQMGPDALDEVLALNSMTDTQLTKYSDLYKEKSKLARNQAVSELEGMRLKNEETMKKLNADATRELSQLETSWKKSISAITTSTKTEMNSLYSIGVNAGQGLYNGLASMEGSLKSKARDIANSISREIQNALKIKSPSRVMHGFGVNIGQGLILGMDDMEDGVSNASLRLADSIVSSLDLNSPTIFGQLGSSILNRSDRLISQTTSSSSTIDNSKYVQPQIQIVVQGDKASPSEIARQSLRTQRQLAMEWGVN